MHRLRTRRTFVAGIALGASGLSIVLDELKRELKG
jgi:hypothetical protein